jgi:hypothetical protein
VGQVCRQTSGRSHRHDRAQYQSPGGDAQDNGQTTSSGCQHSLHRLRAECRGVSSIGLSCRPCAGSHDPHGRACRALCHVAGATHAAASPASFVVRQKGHDIALRALSRLPSSQWSLSVVGNGPLEHSLRRQAVALGVADHVRFSPPTADVRGLYAEHDIVVMPSRWEGLGIVAMEAMACGRPVVASRTGGLRELIVHGTTGWLVEPRNEDALATQLQHCLDHAADCRRVGEAARTYAREHFPIGDMVRAFDRLYRSVV